MDLAWSIAIPAAAATFVFLISLVSVAYFWLGWLRKRAGPDDPELGRSANARVTDHPHSPAAKDSVLRLRSSDIDTYDTVIGEGGFSTVYLASLRGFAPLVAVKVLNSSHRLHRAFRQELEILLIVKHRHIVRLLGYCDDTEEGILVFEYVPNGTLHDSLHGSSGEVLPWSCRMAILFCVAEAVDYLHEHCDLQIIHGDIKTSNVLLDHNLSPKLCDFGSARMGFSATVTRSENQMMGSLGYVDPHHLRTGLASKKSDVYSFGVLVLEVITGIEAFDPEKGQLLTAVLGSKLGTENAIRELVDPKLGDAYEADEVLRMTAIAAQCIAEQPVLRPSMAEVVKIMREHVCIISQKGKPDL